MKAHWRSSPALGVIACVVFDSVWITWLALHLDYLASIAKAGKGGGAGSGGSGGLRKRRRRRGERWRGGGSGTG
jgi:hypothetical protein